MLLNVSLWNCFVFVVRVCSRLGCWKRSGRWTLMSYLPRPEICRPRSWWTSPAWTCRTSLRADLRVLGQLRWDLTGCFVLGFCLFFCRKVLFRHPDFLEPVLLPWDWTGCYAFAWLFFLGFYFNWVKSYWACPVTTRTDKIFCDEQVWKQQQHGMSAGVPGSLFCWLGAGGSVGVYGAGGWW